MASERKKFLMHPDPFCYHFLVSKVAIIDAIDEFANFGRVLLIANVQNRSAKSRARDNLRVSFEIVTQLDFMCQNHGFTPKTVHSAQ